MCYAAFIQLTTQADIFGLGNSTRFIIGLFLFRRIGIESLPCLFRPISSVREGHIAGSFDSSAYTRCRQTVCNLDNARQICILVACIEQLISQLVQYFLDMILFCCRITSFKATGNPLAIGDQSDLGIGSGSLDRKITAIDGMRIICIMAINNSCVTAVIIYGNTLVGILIDYTGAVQLRYIASVSFFQRIGRETSYMIPYRTICHCQIKLTSRCIISTVGNIAYCACPFGTLRHIDIDNRSSVISYLHITGNIQNSGSNAFTGIQVNGTLVGLQSIILAIIRTVSHIRSFNCCSSSRYSGRIQCTDCTAQYVFNIKIALYSYIDWRLSAGGSICINTCCIRANLVSCMNILDGQIFFKYNVAFTICINTKSTGARIRSNTIYFNIGICG